MFPTRILYCPQHGNNAIDDGSILFTTPQFYLNLVAKINETANRATIPLGRGGVLVWRDVWVPCEDLMSIFLREYNFDSIFSAQFFLKVCITFHKTWVRRLLIPMQLQCHITLGGLWFVLLCVLQSRGWVQKFISSFQATWVDSVAWTVECHMNLLTNFGQIFSHMGNIIAL